MATKRHVFVGVALTTKLCVSSKLLQASVVTRFVCGRIGQGHTRGRRKTFCTTV